MVHVSTDYYRFLCPIVTVVNTLKCHFLNNFLFSKALLLRSVSFVSTGVIYDCGSCQDEMCSLVYQHAWNSAMRLLPYSNFIPEDWPSYTTEATRQRHDRHSSYMAMKDHTTAVHFSAKNKASKNASIFFILLNQYSSLVFLSIVSFG